jgi:hypothetical protein
MFTIQLPGRFSEAESRMKGGTVLEEWQLLPDGPITQLREIGEDFWLASTKLGAIQFDTSSRSISTYPRKDIDFRIFERTLVHDWLPVVYQSWGWQVLHASAVVHLPSDIVIAFAGETGAGKSTLGYGLGQRSDWQQISDDSLAFTIQTGEVRLIPIPNAVRLRPASARYYGQQAYSHEPLDLPDIDLSLDYVFFVEGHSETVSMAGSPGCDLPMDGVQTFLQLLKNAYALTLKIPEHNERLLRDYLRLAHQVVAFRLVIHKSFVALNETLDTVESLVH